MRAAVFPTIRRLPMIALLLCAFVQGAPAMAKEPGEWKKSGDFVQANVACMQRYTCHPKTAVLHSEDTFVAVTKPQLRTGVCSAGGGAIDSCNVCLVSEPAEPCVWEVRKKK